MSHVKVVARMRPAQTGEKVLTKFHERFISTDSENKIVQTQSNLIPKQRKSFIFDSVFGPESTQEEVFEEVCSPLVNDVLSGYSCTMFCYGQTGSGKTYTMEGPILSAAAGHDDDSGIMPRALNSLFNQLPEKSQQFSVLVSYIQLYNEDIFDLLTDDLRKLKLVTSSSGQLVVQDAKEIIVKNKYDVFNLLQEGAKRRVTATTKLNAKSSRSHAILRVTVSMTLPPEVVGGDSFVRTGCLNLVDLAGSENIGRSGAMGGKAREAGSINQSLLTLARVIHALVERQPHIPYRESKLTRLLQDSLGGKCKTTIVANLSPDVALADETFSTLEYATKAKSIKNSPTVNDVKSETQFFSAVQEELIALQRDMEATWSGKNAVTISVERYQAITNDLATKENTITVLEQQLSQLKNLHREQSSHNVKLTEDLNQLSNTLETVKQELAKKRLTLKQHEYIISELENTDVIQREDFFRVVQAAESTQEDTFGLQAKVERARNVIRQNSSYSNDFCFSVGQCSKNFVDLTDELAKHNVNLDETVKDMSNHVSQLAQPLVAASQELALKLPQLDRSEELDKAYGQMRTSYSSAHQNILSCQNTMVTSLKEEIRRQFEDIMAHQSTVLQGQREVIKQQKKELDVMVENMDSLEQRSRQSMQDVMTKSFKTLDSLVHKSQAITTDHNLVENQATSNMHVELEKISSLAKQTSAEATKICRLAESSLASASQNFDKLSAETTTALPNIVNNLRFTIDDLNGRRDKFHLSELEATGATPKARVRNFPTVFKEAKPRDILAEEFFNTFDPSDDFG